MADLEVAALEAQIEKLFADWTLEVTKLLDAEKTAITSRTQILNQKIAAVRVPQNADAKALGELPKRINEIVKQETSALKGTADLTLDIKIDVKAKKLKAGTFKLSGTVSDL